MSYRSEFELFDKPPDVLTQKAENRREFRNWLRLELSKCRRVVLGLKAKDKHAKR